MGFVSVDATHFPVIVLKFEDGPKTQQEFQEYVGKLRALYVARTPFRVLFDIRAIQQIQLPFVFQQVAFMKEVEPLTKLYMERAAILIDNGIGRTILDLLFRLRKPAAPTQIFCAKKEATEWLRDVK